MTSSVFHNPNSLNPSSASEASLAHTAILDGVITAAAGVILGKEHELRLALTCLIARGHLLIEDLPGVGKTTLAHVLAKALGLQFRRIQFTSDLLPSDNLGVSRSSIENSRASAFTRAGHASILPRRISDGSVG